MLIAPPRQFLFNRYNKITVFGPIFGVLICSDRQTEDAGGPEVVHSVFNYIIIEEIETECIIL